MGSRLRAFDRPKDVTRNAVSRREIERWLHLTAKRLAVGAARMKSATGWRIHRTGHIAFQNNSLLLSARFRQRHGGKQSPCVRMFSISVDGLTRSDFHDLAKVHDRHPMADVLDDPQIM